MHPALRNRLARVTPFDALLDVQRQMDQLLDNAWRGSAEGMNWQVPADVHETDEEIRCTLEVPGLRPEDIEVVFENSVLTVSGEKKEEKAEAEEGKGSFHRERRYGRFDRSFILPQNVDASRIRADYQNGVLTILLPKTEESKPRRVQINTTGGSQRITTGDNQ